MGELLDTQQVLKMLETFVCECGYRLTDSDLCFQKIEDGFLYECPGCEKRWTLRAAKPN